jgi:DNA-binding protein H-NS
MPFARRWSADDELENTHSEMDIGEMSKATVTNGIAPMRKEDMFSMQLTELWHLHEEIAKILANRIVAEKRALEKRLAQLNRSHVESKVDASELSPVLVAASPPRRKYPRVLPKYRNPLSPSQTWSGRGKTPHWFANALKMGRKIDDFRIVHADKSRE